MKFWAATGLFFGIGVVAGSALTWLLMDRGASTVVAVGFGSIAGAFVAWLGFHLAARALQFPGKPADTGSRVATDTVHGKRPGTF